MANPVSSGGISGKNALTRSKVGGIILTVYGAEKRRTAFPQRGGPVKKPAERPPEKRSDAGPSFSVMERSFAKSKGVGLRYRQKSGGF